MLAVVYSASLIFLSRNCTQLAACANSYGIATSSQHFSGLPVYNTAGAGVALSMPYFDKFVVHMLVKLSRLFRLLFVCLCRQLAAEGIVGILHSGCQ